MQQPRYHDPQGYAQQPQHQAQPGRTTARDWERHDRQGWIRMAIVCIGAIIGGFVLWPVVRSAFVDDRPHFRADRHVPDNRTADGPYGYPVQPQDAIYRRRDCSNGSVWSDRLNCGPEQDGPPPSQQRGHR
jgi:hypothetical protein